MIVQANGVLVAPAKTATNPRPASKSTGAPCNRAKVFPNAAPMKNNGVTSPPLNPLPNVMAGKAIFHHQLHQVAPPAVKQDWIVTAFGVAGSALVPRPR